MYEVERILKHKVLRTSGGKIHYAYLVRWVGYSSAHDTWEPETQFAAKALITQYWKSIGKKP
jgi:hypothetical protein